MVNNLNTDITSISEDVGDYGGCISYYDGNLNNN